ncbi:MAG TPA: aminoglycoside phosphotransferase family protein [Candidatus Obscuribacterales bacterium]
MRDEKGKGKRGKQRPFHSSMFVVHSSGHWPSAIGFLLCYLLPMSDKLLPRLTNEAEFDTVLRKHELWRPAIESICRRHGLALDSLSPFATGSSVIWGCGDSQVIKLMPPFWARDCHIEVQVLERLATEPDLPVPRVLGQGEFEGWPYFVMNRLPGRFCSEFWAGLEPAEQRAIMRRLGGLIKRLHQVEIAGLDILGSVWPAFVQGQLEALPDRMRARGLEPTVSQEWYGLLQEQAPLLAFSRQVLMHCEIGPEHLLLQQKVDTCEISGLIDFGDPLIGAPEYEFGAVCITFTAGRPDLRRELLMAYGYPEAALNQALSRRLLAAALMHRFGTLPIGLKIMAERGIEQTFAECFFSL